MGWSEHVCLCQAEEEKKRNSYDIPVEAGRRMDRERDSASTVKRGKKDRESVPVECRNELPASKADAASLADAQTDWRRNLARGGEGGLNSCVGRGNPCMDDSLRCKNYSTVLRMHACFAHGHFRATASRSSSSQTARREGPSPARISAWRLHQLP